MQLSKKYFSYFGQFKEDFSSKEKLHISIIGRKTVDKQYEHVLNVWNKFEMIEMKTMKNYPCLY